MPIEKVSEKLEDNLRSKKFDRIKCPTTIWNTVCATTKKPYSLKFRSNELLLKVKKDDIVDTTWLQIEHFLYKKKMMMKKETCSNRTVARQQ